MPPALATGLFVAFILWLFQRDSKRSPRWSAGLWVPLIWIAVISSRPVSYWWGGRDSEADTNSYQDGNSIDRNVFLLLIVIGLVILIRRRINWQAVFSQNKWLWLFYLYLALSTLWSEHTDVALKRWIKEIGNVIMILIMVTEVNPAEAIRQVFVRCAYLLVPLSILVIKYYSEIGRYYHRWTWETCYCGIASNKNSLGVLAMVGGMALLWTLADRQHQQRPGWFRKIKALWPEGLVLLMCVRILDIAQSATAISCFVIGALTFFVVRLDWARRNMKLLVGGLLGVALFMLAFTVMPDLRGVIAQALNRDVTLTGRTVIWEEVLKLHTDPLLGEGFASVWLTPEGAALAEDLRIPHAHNGYLEAYLNTGLTGVVLLVGVLLFACGRVRRELSAGTGFGYWSAGCLLGGLVCNYTEATFNNNNIVGFSLFLLAVSYRSSSGAPAAR